MTPLRQQSHTFSTFFTSTPRSTQKAVAELDSVFGTNADKTNVAEQIKQDPYIVNKNGVHHSHHQRNPSSLPTCLNVTVHLRTQPHLPRPQRPKSRQLPITGWEIWPIVHLVNRNEKFFPRPTKFIPERFIPELSPFGKDCALIHAPLAKTPSARSRRVLGVVSASNSLCWNRRSFLH